MKGFILYFLVFIGFMFFFDLLYVFSLFFLSMFIFFLSGFGFNIEGLGVMSLFSIDIFSFYMVLLSFWVFSMVFLVGGFGGFGGFMVLLLFFFLVLSFLSSNIFWFYIFFECSMVPIFFLVIGWGGGEDRVSSGFYMFLYTMVSSLPCLLMILFMDNVGGIMSFSYFNYDFVLYDSFFLFFFTLVFMVKVPIFIFHIWLPKAHVDAPVYGSMILASVMLKLGGYGLFRLIDMFGLGCIIIDWFYVIGLCGLVFVSLICLFSVDMKVIAAYSSVVHMCMMVCGIFSGSLVGYIGGFYMILSHGICSSGVFMMINMFYSRSMSRLLFFNKGFVGVFPVLSFLWLFMIMDNIGAPPSLSFFSEVYCLSSVVGDLFYYFFFIFLGIFIMSCVSMNMFMYGFGGWFGKVVYSAYIKDYFLVFFHLFPLNFSGLFLGYLV